MIRKSILPFVYGGALLIILLIATVSRSPISTEVNISEDTSNTTQSLMTLPPDYRETFVIYAQVDHSDLVARRLYVHPDVAEEINRTRHLPDGTQIVIEAYDALLDESGEVIRDEAGRFVPGEQQEFIHMAEKRSTWRLEDLATNSRAGNWNFASFEAETGQPSKEVISDCFNCHLTSGQTDFIFTAPALLLFARTGQEQYIYCDLPRRAHC